MPNARRIVFGTQVIATQTIEMEEVDVTHKEFQTSPGKMLGGNGVASVNATQWGDRWISTSAKNSWQEVETNWNAYEHAWDDLTETNSVTTTPRQLTTDSNDCAFLYIKNREKKIAKTIQVPVLVSLDGTSGNYYIEIPPEGSVYLRGTDDVECNEIYVKIAKGTADIEWIIAKE